MRLTWQRALLGGLMACPVISAYRNTFSVSVDITPDLDQVSTAISSKNISAVRQTLATNSSEQYSGAHNQSVLPTVDLTPETNQISTTKSLESSSAGYQSSAVASSETSSIDYQPELPIVDLGYEIYRASSYNSSGGYYNFSNIRYAAPPLGELRFSAPVPPATNRSVIQTGSNGASCPQIFPNWGIIANQFLAEYLTNGSYNSSSFSTSGPNLFKVKPPLSEDCLFLDVMVPRNIFENSKSSKSSVLVWIHGGAYVLGSKEYFGNPAGLVERSQIGSADGVIYVSLNYRLGAFGFLSGPSLKSNGSSNVGLLDQRFALHWIQENIHLFGGDPGKVTVIGESAGGHSILSQLTAYGGLEGPAPFSQIIVQSPAYGPYPSDLQQEQVFELFLEALNVTSLQEARQLPSSILTTANEFIVESSPYGQFTFGPVVDGNFTPATPQKLLLQGSYNHSVKAMASHNTDEGLLFTSPYIINQSSYIQYVGSVFPSANSSTIAYITETLYPPVFDGSHGYTNPIQRTAATISDFMVVCNAYYVDLAFQNKTYAYIFGVPPSTHGADLYYTFFNGPDGSVINDSIAITMQEYLTQFAMTEDPNGSSNPAFNAYGSKAVAQDLNVTGIFGVQDPVTSRCLWWQKFLYV